MPKRHLSLTDQASMMLDQYKEKNPTKAYGEVVSEAIVNHVLIENRDYAEAMVESIIERRLHQMENSLRNLMSSIGLDVMMVLVDVLEQRRDNNLAVSAKEDYETLRKTAIAMWNRKRSVTNLETP